MPDLSPKAGTAVRIVVMLDCDTRTRSPRQLHLHTQEIWLAAEEWARAAEHIDIGVADELHRAWMGQEQRT